MTATRTVRLWLLNDEGLYLAAREIVAAEAADGLRDWLRELIISDEAGIASDLLSHALDDVDWESLAADLTEDA